MGRQAGWGCRGHVAMGALQVKIKDKNVRPNVRQDNIQKVRQKVRQNAGQDNRQNVRETVRHNIRLKVRQNIRLLETIKDICWTRC